MSNPDNFLFWLGTTVPEGTQIDDEQKNPLEIFRRVENGGTGNSASSIRVVQDAQRGKVWLFEKPSDEENYRCESNGIVWRGSSYESWLEGQTYEFSWSSRLPDTRSLEHGDFVIFQWKSYQEGIQNYPFLFTVNRNVLSMIHSNERQEWIVVWQGHVKSDQWFDIRVRAGLSRDKNKGTLCLYLNEQRQTFSRNRNNEAMLDDTLLCRTLDEQRGNYPKWGVYNRDQPKQTLRHFVDRLMIKRIE
ncbi:heparin lyase I family protein [Pseudomonas fulva]|nr:heparin lyase I family protein [Pseudomonas fulva]MBF8780661.1 hypothetical protein [Pseudomonas fulva]